MINQHILIKSHPRHIKGYGFTNDIFNQYKYGVPLETINEYKDIKTEFIEDKSVPPYEVNGLKIPYGTLNVYGVPKMDKEKEHDRLTKELEDIKNQLNDKLNEIKSNMER